MQNVGVASVVEIHTVYVLELVGRLLAASREGECRERADDDVSDDSCFHCLYYSILFIVCQHLF